MSQKMSFCSAGERKERRQNENSEPCKIRDKRGAGKAKYASAFW